MTALILRLPQDITDTSGLARYYKDNILTPGTLMLWEPGSPINKVLSPPDAPVNATGRWAITPMPNLAEDIGDLVDTAPFNFTGSLSSNTLTVSVAGSKSLNLGTLVSGGGLPTDARIQEFLTGTGGTGTYRLNKSANVASTTMTATPTTDMLCIRNDGANDSTADMLVDLSTKGGLNVITSQATMTTFRYLRLELPGPIKKYMFDNPSHTYVWSAWYEVTRADLTNAGPYAAIKKNSGSNSGWLNIGRAGPQAITGVVAQSVVAGARNTLGLVHEIVANNYDNTALTNEANNMLATMFGFSFIDGAYGDHGRNKSMSAIVYRLTLEDLTLSGRTFAEFQAKDSALRSLMFASGGRYHGDSATPVSALP